MKTLKIGAKARILGFTQGSKAYRKRLIALGLLPGTLFTLIRQAPLGDPIEILVRGFQLSLRRSEADILVVEEV